MTDKSPIEKILLVDDEKEFVDTVSERLYTRGIISSVAYSGEEALSIVENTPQNVVVLDLKMPGMDGLEALKEIRQMHSEIEVIMLTGHGSAKEETMARELGIFAYLTKPQNIDVLARTIKQAYDKKKRYSEYGKNKVVDEFFGEPTN